VRSEFSEEGDMFLFLYGLLSRRTIDGPAKAAPRFAAALAKAAIRARVFLGERLLFHSYIIFAL